ncbi:hypothetical protein MKQ70_34290 [Chitinophaga sedimenti]|uniref:hypothetical protein n=1 Tax=Chitinophaga sedimenti TaxID=2033606 RepID=UPI0020051AED|nr:hypothetical protein [Chitinophaga sedimenti]MCK7559742.1 hypothetical protein [Chitinophaga sedimenti]
MKGNTEMAAKYRAMILTRGGTDTDADKQALKEAKSGTWPNPLLLRVRLLTDGGFYHEALRLLHGKNRPTLPRRQTGWSLPIAWAAFMTN